MHLTISVDLSTPGFRRDPAEEVARILHRAAEQLVTLHDKYGSLSHEDATQLHLHDNTGAYAGYVSTVEIDAIEPSVQDRICHLMTEHANSPAHIGGQ